MSYLVTLTINDKVNGLNGEADPRDSLTQCDELTIKPHFLSNTVHICKIIAYQTLKLRAYEI